MLHAIVKIGIKTNWEDADISDDGTIAPDFEMVGRDITGLEIPIGIYKTYEEAEEAVKALHEWFKNQAYRYYAGDSEPFYYIDNDTGTFFFMHGSERHDRSFWGWDGTDAWFLVSPADTTIWNDSITDTCMYAYYEKYYWKTECDLYYNVEQKKTFDKPVMECHSRQFRGHHYRHGDNA